MIETLSEFVSDSIEIIARNAMHKRTQVVGYGRSVAQKTVQTVQAYHTKWLKEIGASDSPLDTVAKYYKAKYNNTEDYQLLRGYSIALKKEELNVLTGFNHFCKVSKEAKEKLVGAIATNGITVDGYVPHFIARLIGNEDPRNGRIPRESVSIDSVLDALFKPIEISDVYMRNGERRQKFTGERCSLTIILDTNQLLQVNPKRR